MLLIWGGLEVVVLVDGDDDVPGTAEALGEDDEVAGAELDAFGALDGGLHLALEEVARQPSVELERKPPRRAAPFGPGLDAELKQARLRQVLLDGDGEAGRVCLHGSTCIWSGSHESHTRKRSSEMREVHCLVLAN